MKENTTPPRSASIARAGGYCLAAYCIATAAAIAVAYPLSNHHPLLIAAAADIFGTIVIFAFSYAFRNSSFYDPYWSLAPIVIVVYFATLPNADAPLLKKIIIVALVSPWGLRLTLNWLRGWRGLHHEDWRYVDLRAKHGRAYWLVSFFGIHLLPTLLVYGGCLALYPARTQGPQTHTRYDILATVVTLTAIWIETKYDRQLRDFVLTNDNPQAILDTGLWAYSRHPNYLGELLFWWGLFLFTISVGASALWTITGPIAITLLFLFISIPMIEERHRNKRPQYEQHQQRIPKLIPRLSLRKKESRQRRTVPISLRAASPPTRAR